jgi:hypothetical protein
MSPAKQEHQHVIDCHCSASHELLAAMLIAFFIYLFFFFFAIVNAPIRECPRLPPPPPTFHRDKENL